MLRFNEPERPSFIELAKLILTPADTLDNATSKNSRSYLILGSNCISTPGTSAKILPKINPNCM